MEKLAEGRTKIEFKENASNDEVGYMAHSLQELAKKIIQSYAMQTSLSSVSSALMILDENNIISYVNPKMTNTLDFYYKKNPSVDAINSKEIIGKSYTIFDTFFKKNNDISILCVGSAEFDTTKNTVQNKFNEHLGFVVEWIDRTEEHLIHAEINTMVHRASEGDLTYRIDLANKNGFMHELSLGINKIVNNMSDVINDLAAMFSALASGHLQERITGNYKGVFEQIKIDANVTVSTLGEIVNKIANVSGHISNMSIDLSKSSG